MKQFVKSLSVRNKLVLFKVAVSVSHDLVRREAVGFDKKTRKPTKHTHIFVEIRRGPLR